MSAGFAQWDDSSAPGRPVDVVVREARPSDRATAERIQVESHRPVPGPGAWERMIADPDRCVRVALVAQDIVGWATTTRFADADGPALAGHYLGGVTVTPALRRKGIAHALTAARLAWIGERADAAWYFANASNRVSIRLHDPFGFVLVATVSGVHGATFEGGEGLLFRAPVG